MNISDKKQIAEHFFNSQTKEDLTDFAFVDWYEYKDNTGNVAFVKIRFEHPDGRKWLTTIYPEVLDKECLL